MVRQKKKKRIQLPPNSDGSQISFSSMDTGRTAPRLALLNLSWTTQEGEAARLSNTES